MKKLLFAALVLMLLLPTQAMAVTRTIDLDAMSLEELSALKTEVASAIASASAAVVDGYLMITDYGEYARNPGAHVGESVTFNGTIVQASEGIEYNIYRVSLNGDADRMFYVTYAPSVEDTRILEDDSVTVTGTFEGVIDYTALLGSKVTVPHISADLITDAIVQSGEYAATRQDPAPVGATVRYQGDNWYNKSQTDITVTSVVRGPSAWEIVRKWNRFNDKPDANSEYIIAYVKTTVVASPSDALEEFSTYDFTFVSDSGAAYGSSHVSGSSPDFQDLYAGAEAEGVVATIVPKGDKTMLVYLQKSDTPVWFDLCARKPITLSADAVLTTLQKGDKGDGVKELQTALVELGYLSGVPDGDFGAKTQSAVEKYQRDLGLDATGIADEETLRCALTRKAPET